VSFFLLLRICLVCFFWQTISQFLSFLFFFLTNHSVSVAVSNARDRQRRHKNWQTKCDGREKCFFAATNVLLAAHDCYDWAVVRSSSGPLQLGNVRGAATSCFISSFRLFLSPFLHTHRRTDRQTHVDYTLDSFGAFFRFPSTVFFFGLCPALATRDPPCFQPKGRAHAPFTSGALLIWMPFFLFLFSQLMEALPVKSWRKRCKWDTFQLAVYQKEITQSWDSFSTLPREHTPLSFAAAAFVRLWPLTRLSIVRFLYCVCVSQIRLSTNLQARPSEIYPRLKSY
jgi:hypothetical protein